MPRTTATEACTDSSRYDDHPPLFLDWVADVRETEKSVRPEDRVYLVVSRLRKIRKAKGRLGFIENIGSTVTDLARGSVNATSASFASTRDSSSSAAENMNSTLDEIGEDVRDAWESLRLFLKLGGRSEGITGGQRTSRPSARTNPNEGRGEKSARRFSSSSTSHEDKRQSTSTSQERSDVDTEVNSLHSDEEHNKETSDTLCMADASMRWRDELGLLKISDSYQQDQLYWAKQSSRQFSRGTSHFPEQTKGIAQCHWAIEYRGRYFELQVRKLPHAYQLKEFAFFSSTSSVEEDDRDVLGRIYAGCSHMSCEVMTEIGKGIMKTQPLYELRSDNCQQFIAVLLPRVLCSRHPYMPSLPCGSVPWAQKYTTFPTYVVGIRQGELTSIDHRYYTVTTGLNLLMKHLEKMKDTQEKDLLGAWRGKPRVDFQSTEISTYSEFCSNAFRLQGDDPSAFQTCRPIDENPYLLIHREHKKKDLRPLGNLEMVENDFHLWPKNRTLIRNPLLDQLRQADAVQNGKKLLGSLDRFKSQLLVNMMNET